MFRKFFISTYLVFITIFSLHAQVNDNKAKNLLEQVSEKTKSYKTIKIDFTYNIENKTGIINEKKDGIIYIKGDKYNIDISGQNVISDGKTIWTHIKDADEIHINNVNPQEESLNLNQLLSNYNKEFRSKLIKQETLKGENIAVIDLMPIKGKSYHRVRLTINSNTKQIKSAVIYDKNGTSLSYVVNKFTPDVQLKDDFFTLKTKDYPKAEVIDMR